MKKFKLVKTAAALALGASVVTAAVVPGATDASAASKYKVSNGKLLNAKTGKAVKGYVVYKSKLYYNGKVKKGYKTVGTGKSIKLYYNGTLKKGYKTARDNKLLFFNGKLKKGYKTALSGEYLYKDGFLNKGYKVYGDVDKSPVLYYNGKLKSGYKTANNGTLLFYNGKLKAGYKTAKGGTVLYKEGRLTKGLVEFDGKFYNDSKLANGEVDGTFYKDGKAVVALEGVKAINNTTVEVTFKQAQTAQDIKASRFAIEGLEVKNAAVKQTNDKVVVLTTSAQEAGKTYTLSVDGVKAKSFTAVSSVVPTAVALSTPSIQGVLGKEVTVTAKVTVKDGQSKAGIPVTFNVDANKNAFNKDKVIEAFTDENGVAKISYTQYSKGEDTVYAYPTGAANVKSTVGKVYWGNTERLTVIDVTSGATLANESKKVYKVTSEDNKNGYINVAFKENVDVTPDKLVRTVKVVDTNTAGISNDDYPYQVTTGGVQKVRVKLDSKGEATFTVQGSNATVTPIVFADGSMDAYNKWTGNDKLDPTELQAQANPVTFALNHTQAIDVVAADSDHAAAINTAGTGEGGRTYTATITGKDGKLAPAGTVAYVTFEKGNYSKDKKAYISAKTGETKYEANENTKFAITVGEKGQAKFKLTGERDAFAKPTIYLENGEKAGLDAADLQKAGETTYFVNPSVTKATLKVNDEDKKVGANKPAIFTFQSVDQNGFPYAAEYNGVIGQFNVTFEVAATFNDVEVNGFTIPQGTTKSFTVKANSTGAANLTVTSKDGKSADVTVNASASQVSLGNVSESIQFIKGLDEGAYVSADVLAKINAATDKDAIIDALEEVDNYRLLTTAEQGYVVDTILAERKANKTVSSIFVQNTINEAPAVIDVNVAAKELEGYKVVGKELVVGDTPSAAVVEAALQAKFGKSVTVKAVVAASGAGYDVTVSNSTTSKTVNNVLAVKDPKVATPILEKAAKAVKGNYKFVGTMTNAQLVAAIEKDLTDAGVAKYAANTTSGVEVTVAKTGDNKYTVTLKDYTKVAAPGTDTLNGTKLVDVTTESSSALDVAKKALSNEMKIVSDSAIADSDVVTEATAILTAAGVDTTNDIDVAGANKTATGYSVELTDKTVTPNKTYYVDVTVKVVNSIEEAKSKLTSTLVLPFGTDLTADNSTTVDSLVNTLITATGVTATATKVSDTEYSVSLAKAGLTTETVKLTVRAAQ